MENETDVRKDWFMNQHFSKEQLQQIYDWEQKSGKVADVIQVEGGFSLHHIEDSEKKISLCGMDEEYMLRRWAERLGYKISDGKTSDEYEKENGIADPEIIRGEEIFRIGSTSITSFFKGRKFQINSGDYGLVANRTASNAYEILLLDRKDYNEYLQNKKQTTN